MEFRMKARVCKRTRCGRRSKGGKRKERGAAHADRLRKPIMIIECAHWRDATKRRRGMKKSNEKREDGEKKKHDRAARENGRPQESGAPASARMERSRGEKKIEWREAE